MAAFGIATGAFVAERDDWSAAVGRAAAEGWDVLELTAIEESLLDSLLAFVARAPEALAPFARVSIHAPVSVSTSAASVVERLAVSAPAHDIVFHPDVYRRESLLRELGPRALFENMDVAKEFGRGVDDLRAMFDDCPQAGLCLDVAHVWTNDRSLGLAYELLDTFGDRLRQLHVSGIEPDGTHRETRAADLELYRPVLDRCAHVPWLLEAELSPEPPRDD